MNNNFLSLNENKTLKKHIKTILISIYQNYNYLNCDFHFLFHLNEILLK